MNTKKATLLLLLTITFFTSSFAQKLEEDKVDDFTNNTVKRTSWETLAKKNGLSSFFASYFRISRINTAYYFDLKLAQGDQIFSISDGQELMLKLSNGEVIKLKSLEYVIACEGCGSKGSMSKLYGTQNSYLITEDQIQKIVENSIEKVRIYTTDGYLEEDVKSKSYEKLKKAFLLVME